MKDRLEIIAAFKPNKVDEIGMVKIHKVQEAFTDLALAIEELVPNSADRTAAFRDILKAKFQCVQAITHQQKTTSKINPAELTQQPLAAGVSITQVEEIVAKLLASQKMPTMGEIENAVQGVVDANLKAHDEKIAKLLAATPPPPEPPPQAQPAGISSGRKKANQVTEKTVPETPAPPAEPQATNDTSIDF